MGEAQTPEPQSRSPQPESWSLLPHSAAGAGSEENPGFRSHVEANVEIMLGPIFSGKVLSPKIKSSFVPEAYVFKFFLAWGRKCECR